MNDNLKISLKAARVNAGLTILEAAKQLKIGKDTLIKWEKNPKIITVENMSRLADVYGLPPEYIKFF